MKQEANQIVRIAAFMKRRIYALRDTPRSTLIPWLEWHAQRKSLAYAERHGVIVAAGVARPVNQAMIDMISSDIRIVRDLGAYLVDEESDTVYAEQAASDCKEGLALILFLMLQRFPKATTFMFRRGGRLHRARSYKLKRFVRIAVGLSTKHQTLETAG